MAEQTEQAKSPLREIVQPFVDLIHAPRALWGINLGYMLEGLVYFGILGYLAIYFSDHVFRGVDGANDWAHKMTMVLTAGITLSMVLFGGTADKWGARRALLTAFVLLLIGRAVIASGPTLFGLEPTGVGSALHLVTMAGILFVVIGYGMYQPAAYAGVRAYATPESAGMCFIMLYAVMNLGGWFPTFAFLLRDEHYLNLGIPGVFWVYTGLTAVALIFTLLILTHRTEREAVARVKEHAALAQKPAGLGASDTQAGGSETPKPFDSRPEVPARIPLHMWVLMGGIVLAVYYSLPKPWWYIIGCAIVIGTVTASIIPRAARWVALHPLAEPRFFFFIFALIPVQTLFTYNWFILPAYINRAYAGWIGEYYEVFSNQNPLLVFVLAPIIAALTRKRSVYDLMITGTLIMAAPAFLLAIGTNPLALTAYIVIMTIGEVMWQPRFLQYAAEIAPEGQTGRYVGVAQLPWFLTKVLVPMLYSGKMMDRFCPAVGPKDPKTMWFIFACIALCSPLMLLAARRWVGKDFKTKAS